MLANLVKVVFLFLRMFGAGKTIEFVQFDIVR
jgi:hypothetical protein